MKVGRRGSVKRTKGKKLDPPNGKSPLPLSRRVVESVLQKLSENGAWIEIHRFYKFRKLDHIETTFAALVFRDERLRPADALGESFLGETGTLARGNHQFQKFLIGLAVDRAAHPGLLRL
ncbi:hypothetical protein [Methylosinus sporium]|uniref:hypothetical protein n=1 Tax=Methylosinus sporium TaxID=428 RepID=UPI003CCEC135